MKTLLMSAVIATLAGASATYAASVQTSETAPQAAVTQSATTTDQKADGNTWQTHAQEYPHQHHRNKFTG